MPESGITVLGNWDCRDRGAGVRALRTGAHSARLQTAPWRSRPWRITVKDSIIGLGVCPGR